MEADASDHVEVDPSLQLNQDTTMEETPIESQEPEATAAITQEEPENEEQVTEVAPVVNEDEPMTSAEGESTVTEQAPTETEPITTEETPDIADKPMEEEPKQDISEEVKEEKSDKMETTTSESPLLSTPASWQIPVAALRQPLSDPTTTTSKATLKKEKLEGRIRENPYDVDAWTLLINDVQQTGDLDVIRDMYERFLKVFPTSPKYWLSYLELELKYSNFNEVEALFTRCLKTVLSVDLWKFYLGYIRRINLGESGSAVTPEARGIIEKAYEYVLNNVGMDRDAGPIWADYIYFLKSAETSNTWEEQRKMDSMRRAYQKAVTIPLNNIEHLWKEYDQWENNLNRLTAKKFLGEKSSAYMTARTALREMRLLTDNINTNVAAVPPQWTTNELTQFELWKNYIQWEKNDPLRLEDPEAIMERVSYAYQQAFLALRFYPEIWYSYASYHQEHNKPEKALAIYKQAVEIIPTSLLLNFSYTELCESKKQLEEVRQTYDQLINNLDKEIEELKQKSQQKIAAIQHEADEERASLNLSDDIDGELREQLRSREKQHKKQQTAIEEKTNKQVDIIARACSLVWINYMRFARRTDGIKSARAIFSRARKAANSTYHVYVADALMEYHNSKDATIAGKVFSLGQKSFADNPDFVCQYLDFLIEMNDDNNTRALFERTLATMPPEKAKPIWLKFLDYENKYGDLASVQSVEKRRIEAMEDPKVNAMESFLKRQRYLDIRNIDDYELGGLARQQHLEAIDEEKQQQQQNTQQQQQQQQQQQMQQQQQHILQQQSMKENQKRPLLEPVHPEKYPRPDFNQWQAFKPASRPVNASPIITTVTPTAPPNEPIAPPTSATPAAAVAAAVIQQQQASPIEPLVRSPVPPAAAAAGPWPSNALPDAVAYFVSNLPPAHTFNGPLIQAAELVDVLRNIPLQPQQAPPPLPRSKPMPNRDAPRGGNYNNRPPARGPGGFNKRGGSSRGGGNKQNQKRRARDDYDDDYQTHKGMGPNRPPDFDVFRQRQAKRHRDEPY